MKKTILAIGVTMLVYGFVGLIIKTNAGIELKQLDIKTKQAEINDLNKQLDEIEQEKNSSSEHVEELKKKNEQLQADLQSKRDREALEASNAIYAASIEPKVQETPQYSGNIGNIQQIIIDAANKYGINPNYFLSIAKCESGFNPTAENKNYYENGHPSGLFQHLSGYWPARAAAHGHPGASVFDPIANANVTASMWATGSSYLWECQ